MSSFISILFCETRTVEFYNWIHVLWHRVSTRGAESPEGRGNIRDPKDPTNLCLQKFEEGL